MKINVNYDIALTHILTRKKQTIVAALGVTVGIALYIFSNSIVVGVNNYSKLNMFKTMPHIRIHKEDEISVPIVKNGSTGINLISNPKIISYSKSIINPDGLIEALKKQKFIINAAPQVNVELFYNSGRSQIKGLGSGINVTEADAMFNIRSSMLAGDLMKLSSDMNGIIIGKGIAEKMNLSLGDNISVISSFGVIKNLKVIGVFATENKSIDDTKSYLNISTAHQLIRENSNNATDIYIRLTNPDSSAIYAAQIQRMTEYKVEDWQVENADQMAQSRMMGTMTPLISISIMLVAAFGIYNIINMTITQKMNDIAILKANGFKGKDIITIFLTEAFIMGAIGTIAGVIIGSILVVIASGIYVGPPVGYFPIQFDPFIFVSGIIFGLIVSLGAGYFPARKAARVDPVAIFRK